eukprot:1192994-Prorocentrum_minimum.AAC.4
MRSRRINWNRNRELESSLVLADLICSQMESTLLLNKQSTRALCTHVNWNWVRKRVNVLNVHARTSLRINVVPGGVNSECARPRRQQRVLHPQHHPRPAHPPGMYIILLSLNAFRCCGSRKCGRAAT